MATISVRASVWRRCVRAVAVVIVVASLSGAADVPLVAQGQGQGQGQEPERVARDGQTACGAMMALQLPDVRITEAVAAGRAERGPVRVAHCRVTGVIGREIRFSVWLPNDWNRRFVMGGGGGFVGEIDNQAIRYVNDGYASAATDTGHQSKINFDGSWALDNMERLVNFGHAAVHRVTTVAKAVIRAYYDSAPRKSYFFGCSNGGRQGLMEAQRYPEDFDAIAAGAPALDFTRIAAAFIKNMQALYPDASLADGPVVTADNLKLLESHVLQTCDSRDGIADGVMEDPRECKVTPTLASIKACADDRAAPDCLTGRQRAAIERILSPLVAGEEIYGGQPFGSESAPGGWLPWIVGPNKGILDATSGRVPSLQFGFGTDFFRYFVYSDPAWDYRKYDFSTWRGDTRRVAAVLDAEDTNLDAFTSRGGKLLLWHGWSDPALNPLSTIRYIDQVSARNPASTASSVRLFMMPGVLHCASGPGPDDVDWLQALVEWAEHAKAPDRVVAKKRRDGATVRTRPLCPYPSRAFYKGSGNTDDEANFVFK
jgi:Tannase and feruloyl esterase